MGHFETKSSRSQHGIVISENEFKNHLAINRKSFKIKAVMSHFVILFVAALFGIGAMGLPSGRAKTSDYCAYPHGAPCDEDELDLLCGSDNQTYTNECFFETAVCCAEQDGLPTPTIMHKGACATFGAMKAVASQQKQHKVQDA